MHINSSKIGMESERRYSAYQRQSICFTRSSYTTNAAGLLGSYGPGAQISQGEGDTKESEKPQENALGGETNAWDAMRDLQNRFGVIKSDTADITEQFRQLNRIREQCISYLLKLFDIQRRGPKGMAGDDWCFKGFDKIEYLNGGDYAPPMFNVTTLTSTISYYYEEQETTSFTTTGTVQTADGRSISFDLDLYMSRSFMESYELDSQTISRTLSLCDPLVINLEGNIPDLSDQKFFFDVDDDGLLDEISQMGPSSGFLALDKDGNGRIDNGSELFGTASGDGFADLALYDSDGNGWIDEGDDIWKKLLIWTKDAEGNDLLYHLSEKGIGAICLKNVDTQYSLNSLANNSTNGIIRKTGIFLYENGMAGTLQHLDLAR